MLKCFLRVREQGNRITDRQIDILLLYCKDVTKILKLANLIFHKYFFLLDDEDKPEARKIVVQFPNTKGRRIKNISWTFFKIIRYRK